MGAEGKAHARMLHDAERRHAIVAMPHGRKPACRLAEHAYGRIIGAVCRSGGRSDPGGFVQLDQAHGTDAGTSFETGDGPAPEASRLSELTPQQWKSGTAAWLGWLFDGLDMHLYTLVAAPFVLQLIGAASNADPAREARKARTSRPRSRRLGSGRRVFGRSATYSAAAAHSALTILTYAIFTGLSLFAQTWWQLMIFRFLAALGIGGEWAVGASLLSETWPKRVAPVDRGDAADRRQPRHPRRRDHGRSAVARAASAQRALRVPRGRAAGVPRVLDPA